MSWSKTTGRTLIDGVVFGKSLRQWSEIYTEKLLREGSRNVGKLTMPKFRRYCNNKNYGVSSFYNLTAIPRLRWMQCHKPTLAAMCILW